MLKYVIVGSILLAVGLMWMTTSATFGCTPVDDNPKGCNKSLPTPTPKPTVAAVAPKPQATAPKVAAAPQPKGTSQADAIPVEDKWQTIGPHSYVWYKIDIGNVNHVLDIWMDANGMGNVGFAVYSNYQADMGLGVDTQPTGRGSKNRFFSNDLRWSGRAPRGGTWYVLVNNNNEFAVPYKVGANITEMDPKNCHSYWEYLPSGAYVYWTACN